MQIKSRQVQVKFTKKDERTLQDAASLMRELSPHDGTAKNAANALERILKQYGASEPAKEEGQSNDGSST